MSLQPPAPNIANDTDAEGLKIWSCINCRRRKVRCDRRHPCVPCTRNKTECVFPVSGRKPRRGHGTNSSNVPTSRQAELVGRFRRLQAIVGDLGSQLERVAADPVHHPVEDSTTATSVFSGEIGHPDSRDALPDHLAPRNLPAAFDGSQAGSSVAMGTSESAYIPEELGELEVASNGDLVIGKSFWTVFCKEVEDIFEAVHGPIAKYFDVENTSTMPSGPSDRGHGFYNFLLKNASAARQRKDLHPLPSQMLFLWQVYMENVDPFIKVLHVPTMTKVIREMKGHYNSLGSSMQALVLAISLAAIMSLDEEEVRVNFEADKDQLLARYRLGTEQALEAADLLYSADIAGLRALTIYLGVLQIIGETRPAWFLSGVLVRVAVSLKLHRDGSHFANISPFETEMRRRLWWHICFIDRRSEDLQLADFKLSERMFDTRLPLNTDDKYLDPTMSELHTIADRWTDMTVCLTRCEIWKVSSRIQTVRVETEKPQNNHHKMRELFQQSYANIEDMLKRLDSNQPLHTFLATSARLFLVNVDLILHTARNPPKSTAVPSSDAVQSDSIFMLSILKLEYTYALQNEPSWSGWSWQNHGHQPPWNALRVVLGQICTHDWRPIYERGWSSAKRSFDGLPEAARGDVRYQQLSVQINRANQLHQESILKAPPDGLGSAAPVTLSPLLPQGHIFETAAIWTAQEPFMTSADNPNNHFPNDLPNLDMDWQTWDELTADFDPCMEFWDSSGF